LKSVLHTRTARFGIAVALVAIATLAASGISAAQTGYQLDSVTPSDVSAGSAIHVHSNGWCAGGSVTVTLSRPGRGSGRGRVRRNVALGTLVANGEGIVDGDFTIPADTSPGKHDITLTGQAFGCTEARTEVLSITVVPTQVLGTTVVSSAASSAASSPVSGALAFTGADAGTLLAIGAAAVIVGTTALVGARRRRSARSA
jgi:hypothetical protein